MKAVVYERYGGPEVLEVREVTEPQASGHSVRVAVHAAGLNPKDVLIRKGRMRWLARAPLPRTPGYDVAGVLLDAVGDLPAGAPVFGMIQANAGGACAEVAALKYGEVAAAPVGLSMVQAASLPLAGLTALQALRDELGVRPGQTVLLNGASGGVGTLAVQVAKVLGARVIAVCSERNAELVKSLGADRVIDYQREDVAAERGLDHVFDIYGSLPWERARPMICRGGGYCTTIPTPKTIARALLNRVGLHRASLVVVKSRRADLEWIAKQVNAGSLRAVVDLTVPLESSDEGHRHLETRRARGKVVVDVRGHRAAGKSGPGLN